MAATIPQCNWVRPDPLKSRYTPGTNYCAVQVWKEPRITQGGGLTLPDNVQVTQQTVELMGTPLATVVVCGPDVRRCAAGDIILMPAHSPGIKVWFKGEELILVKDDHVVGVVNPDELRGR